MRPIRFYACKRNVPLRKSEWLVVEERQSSKSQQQLFLTLREYVKHQYDLTNHRTVWLASTQTLMLTAYGLLHGLKPWLGGSESDMQAQISAYMIGCVGISITFVVFFLLESARHPIEQLALLWEAEIGVRKIKKAKELRRTLILRRQILLVGGLSRRAAFWGRLLTLIFPLLLAIAWSILIYRATPIVFGATFSETPLGKVCTKLPFAPPALMVFFLVWWRILAWLRVDEWNVTSADSKANRSGIRI